MSGPWVAGKAAWFRGQTVEGGGKIPITAGAAGVVANVYGVANAHLIAAAPDLLVSLKELRDAMAAAMRVIADIDAGKFVGLPDDTKYQRLIDECAVAGVVNGFGKRADAAIAKAEGRP
jgi:hypothetical protein